MIESVITGRVLFAAVDYKDEEFLGTYTGKIWKRESVSRG